jgi:predicted nucleic acid-binding protein
MSRIVVDASVGIKRFAPEVHSAAAKRLQNSAYHLHVPGFFDVEVGNILWKKVWRGELTEDEAAGRLVDLAALQLIRHPDQNLVAAAFRIAAATGRTVYDSVYVALAVQLSGQTATADERLRNALRGTNWERYVLWVEDIP